MNKSVLESGDVFAFLCHQLPADFPPELTDRISAACSALYVASKRLEPSEAEKLGTSLDDVSAFLNGLSVAVGVSQRLAEGFSFKCEGGRVTLVAPKGANHD